VYIPCVVFVTVTASTATVAIGIRYAERLLPLGGHARNSHVRRQQQLRHYYDLLQ